MNEKDYDNRKITAYLLADLSEEETVRFDELAFTDEQFAAAFKSAENNLIDSYLQGELADATLGKFETYYLASAHRREKVKFARALQTFVEKEIGTFEKQRSSEKVSFRDFFASPLRLLQFGFAAAALLVVAFGIFWLANSQSEKPIIETAQKNTPTPQTAAMPNQTDEQNNINANVEISPSAVITDPSPKPEKSVNENTKPAPGKEKLTATPQKPIVAFLALAAPLRGSNKIPLFTVPKNAAKIAVELELEGDEYDFYHVKLAGETGKTNLRLNGSFKARNRGGSKVLNLNFPSELLNDGIYLLTVSGIKKDGEAEVITTYPFRCVIK